MTKKEPQHTHTNPTVKPGPCLCQVVVLLTTMPAWPVRVVWLSQADWSPLQSWPGSFDPYLLSTQAPAVHICFKFVIKNNDFRCYPHFPFRFLALTFRGDILWLSLNPGFMVANSLFFFLTHSGW